MMNGVIRCLKLNTEAMQYGCFEKYEEGYAFSMRVFSGLDNTLLESDEEIKNDRRDGCSAN